MKYRDYQRPRQTRCIDREEERERIETLTLMLLLQSVFNILFFVINITFFIYLPLSIRAGLRNDHSKGCFVRNVNERNKNTLRVCT